MKKLFLCGLLLLAFASATRAQAMSKQDVLRLTGAGVDSDVIIHKIKVSGISFEMTTDTILELKKAGVPKPVLTALLSAKITQPPTPVITVPVGPDMQAVRTLYGQGHYAELGDYLKAYLAKTPSDSKARTMLVTVLLKLKNRKLANEEFSVLKQDGSAGAYVTQIEKLLQEIDRSDQAKAKLLSALQQYNAVEAANAIEALPSSPLQKAVLNAYLSLYQARFEQASEYLQNLKSDKIADQEAIKKILPVIEDSHKKHEEITKHIDAYLYSEVTSNTCNSFLMQEKNNRHGKFPSIKAEDLHQYVRDVLELATMTPLEPQVMDLTFHASLLGRDYADVERLGDKILKAKGNLRVPFLSESSYFWVVIDGSRRRISSAPDDQHKFQVYYDYPALNAADYTPFGMFHAGRGKYHGDQARWYEKSVPFDLSFDEVQGLSQKAKDWRGGLEAKAYAVKLTPAGLAPNYLLMNVLACVYGEEAQRSATRNLGQFIAHVMEPHKIQAELVDPSKHTVDIWGEGHLMSSMAGVYGSMAQRSGDSLAMQNAALLSSVAQKEEQQSAERQQQQEAGRQAWYQAMADTGLTIGGDFTFEEIEKLLGLL